LYIGIGIGVAVLLAGAAIWFFLLRKKKKGPAVSTPSSKDPSTENQPQDNLVTNVAENIAEVASSAVEEPVSAANDLLSKLKSLPSRKSRRRN
jgi:flagellar basal body-associated protein FliL